MVCCSVSCCASNSYQNFKNRKMVFFNVPPNPKPTIYEGKHKAYRTAMSNIKRNQHKAWVSAINKSHPEGNFTCSDTYNTRLCLHHFHPSVIYVENSDKYTLKIGAAPTMYLTKLSFQNDNFKEEKHLQRIVGDPEDLQCVYEYNINHSNEKSHNKLSSNCLNATIVTPTRESRTCKRRHEKAKIDNQHQMKKYNKDIISTIQDLYENFPKISR